MPPPTTVLSRPSTRGRDPGAGGLGPHRGLGLHPLLLPAWGPARCPERRGKGGPTTGRPGPLAIPPPPRPYAPRGSSSVGWPSPLAPGSEVPGGGGGPGPGVPRGGLGCRCGAGRWLGGQRGGTLLINPQTQLRPNPYLTAELCSRYALPPLSPVFLQAIMPPVQPGNILVRKGPELGIPLAGWGMLWCRPGRGDSYLGRGSLPPCAHELPGATGSLGSKLEVGAGGCRARTGGCFRGLCVPPPPPGGTGEPWVLQQHPEGRGGRTSPGAPL